jgi:ribonuclease D
MVEATGMDKAKPDTDKEWRIKGTRQLDKRQLAYVRNIWRWREHQAKRADLPPFKILVNHQLLELATWAQRNPGKSLAKGPKLPRNCTGNRCDALRKAIEKSRSLGESSLPRIPRPTRSNPPTAECKKLAELLRSECHRIADELDVEPFVLAPRATIAAVARNRPDSIDAMMACGPMMQWQAELLLPIFSKHF